MDRVDGDQREATVGDRGLVDRLAVELGGRGDRAADERQAPDQGDVAAAPAVGAPAADDVVVEVDLPVGVVVGGDVGEVGLRPQVGGLAAVLARGERDPAVVLGDVRLPSSPAVGSRRVARHRHVHAPAPGAVGKPAHRLAVEPRARLGGERLAGAGELAPAAARPSGRTGDASCEASAMKRGSGLRVGGIGRAQANGVGAAGPAAAARLCAAPAAPPSIGAGRASATQPR